MAIERKSKSFAFNSEVMPEDQPEGPTMEAAEPEMPEAAEGEDESTTIPMALLGGQQVAPGDVVRLEVVSSDPDSGMVTVRYAKPAQKEMM